MTNPGENLYKPGSIRTFTGLYLHLIDPQPDKIDIFDIAHALSMRPRFGGHLNSFFSIAQHSVMVSAECNKKNALAGLLHDASEAYISDIPAPLKVHLPEYRKIEDRLMVAIAEKFSFEYPPSDDVRRADKKILEFEWSEVMLAQRASVCWPQARAFDNFIDVYEEITNPNRKGN